MFILFLHWVGMEVKLELQKLAFEVKIVNLGPPSPPLKTRILKDLSYEITDFGVGTPPKKHLNRDRK